MYGFGEDTNIQSIAEENISFASECSPERLRGSSWETNSRPEEEID